MEMKKNKEIDNEEYVEDFSIVIGFLKYGAFFVLCLILLGLIFYGSIWWI